MSHLKKSHSRQLTAVVFTTEPTTRENSEKIQQPTLKLTGPI